MTIETGDSTQGTQGRPAPVAAERAMFGLEEYRTHIGPADFYDLLSAIQFNLLTALGLRETHRLLDVGCGSLRAGRLFIPYLRPGHYFGIEPLSWLIQEGIEKEIGDTMIRIKRPTFGNDENFSLSIFNQQFDFIIAQSIFSHASQAQIQRCVAEAKKVLKPDGVFAATFFVGSSNYEGAQWTYKADYTMEHMRWMVEQQGMTCTPIDWRHPDPQQWVLIHHPGTTPSLAKPTDAQNLIALQERLERCEQQYLAIKSQPYVSFGLKVKALLFWLGFEWRKIVRRLRGLRGGTKA